MSNIIKINPVAPEHPSIEYVADILCKGGVIGYPTETIYGMGCNALNVEAVERIYRLKNRDRSKAMILIAGDTVQVSELVISIPEAAEKLIENFWPGPLTIVFEASSRLKEFAFGKSKTIGIRIPDSALCLELIKETGFPLVSTSANISGQPASISAEQVANFFGDQLDVIVDGGPSAANIPSTVVDITRSPARVVREGAISALEINTVLEIE
ncbi:threonylcarbamoyl-AMP synthase [candidate division KSB1 bacterium]|nr:threonylcarbamoyl-AMP synthase [candidate division KSB1 bacterium]RQW07602.1 MAG: threonylcarbamoyl-AMP synthase [candidate division KSB1 bacterium]